MSKKVLIFSTAYLPHTGGAEIAIEEITDRLSDHDFDMVTARLDRSWSKKEQIKNITVHRVGIGWPIFDKLLLAFLGHRKALKLHREKEYDLIWSIMASYNSFTTLSFKERTDVPYLLTLQAGNSMDYMEKKTQLIRNRYKKVFTKADGLQAISTYLMEWGKKMGFDGEVKEIVPNGVDLDVFDIEVSDEKKQQVRDELEVKQDDFVLVTASRLVKKNGIEYVVRALADLPEEVKFVVCGEGELGGKIREVAQDLGVKNRVLFQDNVDHNRLVNILHASDVFIRPSLTEGLGNAFLEAMATGTPIIGTKAGGISDFLEDGETGFVCEPKDPDSIVEAVERIRGLDESELKGIESSAQELVRSKYNWNNIAEEVNKIFKTISI
ncbi:MAG: glycosyltransferase family 4 protein [Candidatus Magasanikbacteria bacterium]